MRYFKNKCNEQVASLNNINLINQNDWYEISKEEYDNIMKINIDEPSEKDLKIGELKQNLSNTDYKLFKYLEGDLTKEEYLPIMENRKRWRREINELEGESATMPAQIK